MSNIGGLIVDIYGACQSLNLGFIDKYAAGFFAWPLNNGPLNNPSFTAGAVCTVVESSQSRTYLNGFARDINGRIIIDSAAAVARQVAGIGLSAAGAVCVDSHSPVVAFVQGIGLTAAGKLSMSASQGLANPDGPYNAGNWSLLGTTTVTATGVSIPAFGNIASTLTAVSGIPNGLFSNDFVGDGNTHRLTFYAHAGTAPFLGVSMADPGGAKASVFNLNTGAITNINGGPSQSSALAVGGGWWFITYRDVETSTTGAFFLCWDSTSATNADPNVALVSTPTAGSVSLVRFSDVRLL